MDNPIKTYNCIARLNQHQVGCPHKEWPTKDKAEWEQRFEDLWHDYCEGRGATVNEIIEFIYIVRTEALEEGKKNEREVVHVFKDTLKGEEKWKYSSDACAVVGHGLFKCRRRFHILCFFFKHDVRCVKCGEKLSYNTL